jgi:hypothetical protein
MIDDEIVHYVNCRYSELYTEVEARLIGIEKSLSLLKQEPTSVQSDSRVFEMWICLEPHLDWKVGDLRTSWPNDFYRKNWKEIKVQEVLEARTLKPE